MTVAFGRALRPMFFNPKKALGRQLSTLQGNSHIFVFPNQSPPNTHTLSLLPTEPPAAELAIGTTSKLPPTPESFKENHGFLNILQSVISEYAHEDPDVKSQAHVMASTSGANLGSGGVFFSPKSKRKGSDGGASAQGGAGSGGRGGFIHVSDSRNPPEYGRISWPEDIFGSLEANAQGDIEGNGNYQSSGTYRVITRNGMLGLSPFLREKLVQRLQSEEEKLRQ